jgi:RNA polymerase sigma-70 factor, ECF subfamily
VAAIGLRFATNTSGPFVHPRGVTDPEADVRAARDGDRDALDRVLRTYWARAFRIAVTIVRDPALAEDAAQDALVLVATRLDRLRDPAAFPAWSGRVAVNSAKAALRRTRYDRSRAETAPEPAFEDAAAARIDVLRVLDMLPLWLRVPLVLRYVDGLSSREIGAALGAPAATIRFRLALGRRRFAALLREGDIASSREEFA